MNINGVKLIDFLNLYSFRMINDIQDEDKRNDSNVVRIYYDENEHSKWFEFSVNDWSGIYYKSSIISDVLKEDILNQYVSWFEIDEYTSMLHIYVQKEKEIFD